MTRFLTLQAIGGGASLARTRVGTPQYWAPEADGGAPEADGYIFGDLQNPCRIPVEYVFGTLKSRTEKEMWKGVQTSTHQVFGRLGYGCFQK